MAARSASSAAVVVAVVSIFAAPSAVLTHQASAGAKDGNGHEVGTFSRPISRPISNSLWPRKAVAIETSSWRADFEIGTEEVLARRWTPLGQSGGGERCPAGFERVVEQVAVGEVLDQETVGIAPVVEDLAALDVSADAPGPEIATLPQVFAAGGQGVEVADLIGRMDVAVGRAQRHRQGVMVGRGETAIAADEAHRRSSFALAGEEQEVADDHPQVVQVPVEGLEVLRRLHHQMAQALHPGGRAPRTLGVVDAPRVGSEVERKRLLRRQFGQLGHARDHADRHAAGIDQVDGEAADGVG